MYGEIRITFKDKDDYERLMDALYSGANVLENVRSMSDVHDRQATVLREHAEAITAEMDQ